MRSAENHNEEWKEGWHPSYLDTIAAFYNTDGGRMYIGRKDNGEFIDIRDFRKLTESITSTISNKLHIYVDVRIEVSDDGKHYIIIDVPKGDSLIDYDGRFYRRSGNTTRRIEGFDLRVLLLAERGRHWLDEPSGITLREVSAEALSRFVSMGRTAERIDPNVDGSDINWILGHYGLLTGPDEFSIAGAIMFSEFPLRANYGAAIRIGEFDAKGILIRGDDIEVPMILAPDIAVRTLFDRYVRSWFEYRRANRVVVYDYPEDAIRELILNAVVHMDYTYESPVLIRVYADRIEISCCGDLPTGWTTDTLLERHDSIPRNGSLARVFYDAGYIEKWGQGISKVFESCHLNGNPEPEFVLEDRGLAVTIRSKSSIDGQFESDTPVVSITDTENPITLTDNQRAIISVIATDPSITVPEMCRILGLSKSTVDANISKLTKAGVLTRVGSDKTGIRLVNPRYIPNDDSN